MPDMTLEQAYELALRHHEAGQLREAEEIYRQILTHAPNHADSLHLLGVAAGQQGRRGEAVELIRRAIAHNPSAQYLSNLGTFLSQQGNLEEAIVAHRQALALRPDFTEARGNLASALIEKGDAAEALKEYQRVVVERPDWANAHNGLANCLATGQHFDQAIESYHRAIALRENYPEAFSNLSNALRLKGEVGQAIDAARKALALRPHYAPAWVNLGAALRDADQIEQAIDAFRQAVATQPDLVQAWNNLATAYRERGCPDQAIDCCRKALAIRADSSEAHGNLGNALKDTGRIDEAITAYRKALTIRDDPAIWDSLLMAMHYAPGITGEQIFQEHLHWARTCIAAPAEVEGEGLAPAPGRDSNRRLRIGYVSPDFTSHPVGRFLFPLLANHDRNRFEVFCYSDVRRPDSMTRKFKSFADVWRETRRLSDPELATQIGQDGIDILVDLALHSAANRLRVFARKPAPVQVTWLGYPGTSGLQTMDYRLSDPYLDPAGLNDQYYSEQTMQLPDCYWCHDPLVQGVPVNPLPAQRGGPVTFGCLNNFAKVTVPTIDLWARVLQGVSSSRLLVLAPKGSARERLVDRLHQSGIGHERIEFTDRLSREAYLALYHRIDVSLDTFPYNGHTTSFDSLWMGVPVVSLFGQTAVSRGGLSVLSNLAMGHLATDDPDKYVRIAVELVQDLPSLAALRASLRERMERSPLMDQKRFAGHVEAAYCRMWDHCVCDTLGSRTANSARET